MLDKLADDDRIAIVTNAGGPGVMTTDSLIALEGKLATLSDQAIEELVHAARHLVYPGLRAEHAEF